jgi:hypothetical protein
MDGHQGEIPLTVVWPPQTQPIQSGPIFLSGPEYISLMTPEVGRTVVLNDTHILSAGLCMLPYVAKGTLQIG